MNMTKMVAIILVFLLSFMIGCDSGYPNTPREVWGDLEEHEGRRIWDTLTLEQQALVNYPKFDRDCVYWVSNGKSYHSVKWCYTLNRSKNIQSGSLEEAIKAGKTDPCSMRIPAYPDSETGIIRTVNRGYPDTLSNR